MTKEEALDWLVSRKEHYEMDDNCQELAEAIGIGIDAIKQVMKKDQGLKVGYWIHGKYRDTCSECRYAYPKKMGLMNFCPACGVKMVESEVQDEVSN